MKFKKIILTNFRQFKGKNELNFSTDDEKNITIVYGGITFGKTTLLQAFNWVFYNTVKLENPNDLLNKEVADNLEHGKSADVEVEIYLEFNGENYKLKRKQTYTIYPNEPYNKISSNAALGTAEKEQNDTWIPAGNYEEIINKIMPSNLSTYFFFDGERIDNISEQQRKGSKEVENSVKEILGLEHYSTAIKHLSYGRNSVLNELRSRINTTANSELYDLRKEYEKLDAEIEENNERIKRYEIEIDLLDRDKKAKEQVILENKTTYEKQQEKINLKGKLDNIRIKEENSIENFKAFFNNYYLDFFYYGLNDKMKELGEVLSIEEEGIPNMHAHSIEYILNRGYCICGEKFKKNDLHYNALLEEMKKLPPQSIGSAVANFNKELRTKISEEKSANFKNEIISKFENILQIIDEKNRLQDQIDKLSNNIATDINVGELERDVKEIENKIRDYTGDIAVAKEQNNLKEQRKINIDKDIARLSQYDDRNIEINKQIRYAEKITKILQSVYDKKEIELKEMLEQEINKYLTKIYTGERYLKITDDYKFRLVYADDKDSEIDAPASEGLGTVKAISFMCGLLDVAKSKFLAEVTEETEYPLVFDAPLSKIDSIHIRNVMECLPDTASQVIFFIREERDLAAITDRTKNRIGRSYYIKKISEKHSEIRLVKEED